MSARDDLQSQALEGNAELALRDGCVHTRIDTRCYRLSAVQKTGYKLANRCTLILGALDAELLPVTIAFPPATGEPEARGVVRLFFQELLDQELREKIGDETGPLRALLLAHAFSKTDLVRRE